MTTNNKYDFYHIRDKSGFAVHLNENILFSKENFNKEVTLMTSYFNKNFAEESVSTAWIDTPTGAVDEKAITEIINDNFKGLIQIPNSYFHYFPDFIGPIFVFLENCIKSNIKKVELVFLQLEEKQPTVQEFNLFLNYCLDTFKDRIEISYLVINQSNKAEHVFKTYIRVNNSTIIDQYDIGVSLDFIYESAKGFAELSDDTIPNKKVFLSRKNDMHKDNADNRHIYEDDAEKFFRSIGFEVVNGEAFASLKEQIAFFDQVSVFAGYTGSGLTSSMFMKPGQTLIEIVCPIKFGTCVNDNGDEWEIHNFYKTFSILKNHTYVAVPNVDRSKESFLRDLEKVSRMF
jgi:hypothetical protein